MSGLKISTRLGILIGVLTILLLAVGLMGLMGVHNSNASLKTVYEDRVVCLDQLGQIDYLLQRNRVLVMDMMLRPDPANIANRDKEFRGNLVTIGKQWDAYMATYLTPEESELAKNFAQAKDAYLEKGLIPADDAIVGGKLDVAQTLYLEKLSPLAPASQEGIRKLIQLQLDVSKQEYESAITNFDTVRLFSISAIVTGILFALGFGYIIVRSIAGQLGGEPQDAVCVAMQVANGDLTTTTHVRTGDSTSLIVQLQKMQSSLALVVSNVLQGSEAVATASAQIAQGNSDLSSRTENQASALEETAASMEELSSQVNQNADSARRANQLAASASTIAVHGGDVVGRVIQTMNDINESSNKIADIIGVIDGIAFQTNILALNAAVEAARAGEQGRGFAVVASEVRSLAGRSADAAKEIKHLINASVERLGLGTNLVSEAGTTMSEVIGSIRQVSDLMGEISAACSEQSAGVLQIGQAIQQVDMVTQQNAALVEEMAAAANNLRSQSSDLVRTVAVFKINSASNRIGTEY